MAAKKKSVSAVYKQEKATKNTVRFQAESDGAFTPYIYILNDAMKSLGNPKSITVTVEAA